MNRAILTGELISSLSFSLPIPSHRASEDARTACSAPCCSLGAGRERSILAPRRDFSVHDSVKINSEGTRKPHSENLKP
jgi:hypothetical protein